MQGQRTAKKTKRALSVSHTNPALNASEEQLHAEQQQPPPPSSPPPESNNNVNVKSVEIEIEKREPLASVPEDLHMSTEEVSKTMTPALTIDMPNQSVEIK